MYRIPFVALCTAALFVMAPFTLTEDVREEFIPPENPVTNLYAKLTNGMSADELTSLAEQCGAERDWYVPIGIWEDGVHEYWTYRWTAKPPENARVELTATVVKGKVSGTMYVAETGAGSCKKTDAGDAKTKESFERPTNTRLERAFRKLKYGMTEAEVRTVVERHTREPRTDLPGTGWENSYATGPKISDYRWYGPDYPKEGIPGRNLDWTGDADADMNHDYNGSDTRRRKTHLHTVFDETGHLRFATYQCSVELIFPNDDLMLREDGVHPYNAK